MTSFTRQRWAGLLFLIGATAVAWFAHAHWSARLTAWDYFTGWVLFAVMVMLTVFNARKKIPFLPLGTSEGWLQFHIYSGYLTIALLLVHLRFRPPGSGFGITLFVLYAIVTGSGIAGLVLTRVLPRRLTTRGGEVIYEKIPTVRRSLQQQAESLALAAIPGAKSTTIADFYARRLRDYFNGPRDFWLHLAESRRPLSSVMDELNDLRRFLNNDERAALDKIAALVRQKDGLDYHHALQTTLKLWLFVHLPFTYGLMLFTLAHIVIVYAFSGGAK
ncbi:MAG: hypothetical protein HY301_13640 [Verrucomicrobia bacterium]|nr:hypothetical protein [Verrucomicrobiota bacterium]